jgi:hypothetical protein
MMMLNHCRTPMSRQAARDDLARGKTVPGPRRRLYVRAGRLDDRRYFNLARHREHWRQGDLFDDPRMVDGSTRAAAPGGRGCGHHRMDVEAHRRR